MMIVRFNVFVQKTELPFTSYLCITKAIAFPTAKRKEGNTRSVGVNPWTGRARLGRYSGAEGQTAPKFYGSDLAGRQNRWRAVLDSQEWQSGHRHGAVHSLGADGRRGWQVLLFVRSLGK